MGELISNNAGNNNENNPDEPATSSENVVVPSIEPLSSPITTPPEFEIDYYSSSVESSMDEEKVYLQIGEILKSRLEYDHKLITQELVNISNFAQNTF